MARRRKKTGPLSAKHRAAISRALRNKFGGRSKSKSNKAKRNRRIAGALVGGGLTAAGLGLLYKNKQKQKTEVQSNNNPSPSTDQRRELDVVMQPAPELTLEQKKANKRDRTEQRKQKIYGQDEGFNQYAEGVIRESKQPHRQSNPDFKNELDKMLTSQSGYRKAKKDPSLKKKKGGYKSQRNTRRNRIREVVDELRSKGLYNKHLLKQELINFTTKTMLYNDYSNIPGVVEFAARYQQANELAEFARRKGSKDKKARKKKGMGLAAKAGLAAGAAAAGYGAKAALQARRARQGKKWGSAKTTLGVMRQDAQKLGNAAVGGVNKVARAGYAGARMAQGAGAELGQRANQAVGSARAAGASAMNRMRRKKG